jgi:hypothetical protein
MNRERTRRVGDNATEIRLVVTDDFLEKINRLKELLSHSVPSGSVLEIFEKLVGTELVRLEKKRGISQREEEDSPATTASKGDRQTPDAPTHPIDTNPGTAPVPNETKRSGNRIRQAISAETRRTVWQRAKGTCEIPGCGSRFRLEIDHIIPHARGGSDDVKNLRLLCRTHNLERAKACFGANRMQNYVGGLR